MPMQWSHHKTTKEQGLESFWTAEHKEADRKVNTDSSPFYEGVTYQLHRLSSEFCSIVSFNEPVNVSKYFSEFCEPL
jgi:hypothetical protein